VLLPVLPPLDIVAGDPAERSTDRRPAGLLHQRDATSTSCVMRGAPHGAAVIALSTDRRDCRRHHRGQGVEGNADLFIAPIIAMASHLGTLNRPFATGRAAIVAIGARGRVHKG